MGKTLMLKREDKFSAGEVRPGDQVRFADAEGEEFPLSYEGEVVAAYGASLRVRLSDVRPISLDHQLPEQSPRTGEEMSILVADVSVIAGEQRD